MSDRSAIEWTDATWNPLRGVKGRHSCVKISEGCQNCYAERMNVRFGGPEYKVGADELRLDETALTLPLRWKKPRRVFVCSMTDLFEERVPDKWIERIFEVMLEAPHAFQVLTKRAERLCRFVTGFLYPVLRPTVLEHIWLGVSVENQARADERIPWLLKTPAAVRFLSVEPLLGPVSLEHFQPDFHWVIVGGESGPGARPMNPDWARTIRDQCVAAGVPYFFKQFGGPTPKSGGRLLDGRAWDEFPRL